MSAYSLTKIKLLIDKGLGKSETTKARGDAFEELICYLLCELPGINVLRNARDPFQSQEIDVTVSNAGVSIGMKVFPTALLVECKNWDDPVGVTAVTDFIFKLMAKYVDLGIIVAANGITGDKQQLTAAYQRIAIAQSKGHRVLILTLEDLKAVKTTGDFESLLINKFLEAVGSGKF